MFALVISFLITFNLPWFMDLIFQVPMQYCSYSIEPCFYHQSPFTTGLCFCFGSVSSFFLELFLHWSSVEYGVPTDLGSSPQCPNFFPFILFMGFSRQEYWSGWPLPSPVGPVSSELSTMTHLSWVALHGMAHSFIELVKPSIITQLVKQKQQTTLLLLFRGL